MNGVTGRIAIRMNKAYRRLLVGLLIGLAVAVLELVLVTTSRSMSPDVITMNNLGGTVRLLLAGGLLGAAYALLFRPQPAGHADNIMSGVVLGFVAWVVLAINLFPLLQTNVPMWDVQFASNIFPKLIAYVLQGTLVGLLYGMAYERLGLAPAVAEPPPHEVQTNVVIIGGGYAGVSAAESLDEAFAQDSSVAIWLVSQTNYLLHRPSRRDCGQCA